MIEAWRLFVLACKQCGSGQINLKIDVHPGGRSMSIKLRCTECGNYEERTTP